MTIGQLFDDMCSLWDKRVYDWVAWRFPRHYEHFIGYTMWHHPELYNWKARWIEKDWARLANEMQEGSMLDSIAGCV